MRTVDELYWDSHCDERCGCKNLKEALAKHPELRKARDGEGEASSCQPNISSSKIVSHR